MKTILKLSLPFSDKASMIVRLAIGLTTGLVGIVNMLSVIVYRPNGDILQREWPIAVYHGVGVYKLTVVIGFFLVMLSYGLIRGKYQAWVITLVLLMLSFVLHTVQRGSLPSTLIALTVTLTLTILLSVLYRYFQARSNPPSMKRGYIVLTLGLGIVVFYTITGFIVHFDQFAPLVDRFGIVEVFLRLLTNAHLHIPPGTQAFFFERALPALCVSAVLYGMVSILRPVAKILLPNEEERHVVASNTRIYGKNSISYFALSEEKAYFFSVSRRAFHNSESSHR